MIIDTHFSHYAPFYDHAWAKELIELTETTPLREVASDLTVAYRGCVNTYIVPWLMVTSATAFANAFTSQKEPYLLSYVSVLRKELASRMELNPTRTKKLQVILSDIAERTSVLSQIRITFNEQEYWDDLIDKYEMQMSIWGSQRLCYSGLYYGYEDLVLRVYRIISGESSHQIDREFVSRFRTTFGETILNQFWTDPQIDIARKVRHSLAHAGGRITPKLQGINHGIAVENEELQLMPRDSRLLFSLLTARSLGLVKHAVSMLPITA